MTDIQYAITVKGRVQRTIAVQANNMVFTNCQDLPVGLDFDGPQSFKAASKIHRDNSIGIKGRIQATIGVESHDHRIGTLCSDENDLAVRLNVDLIAVIVAAYGRCDDARGTKGGVQCAVCVVTSQPDGRTDITRYQELTVRLFLDVANVGD